MADIDIIFDDQTVVGTDEDDDIRAGFFTFDPPGTTRGRNDTIFALGGADDIRPGDGNDSAFGGSGDDFVFGVRSTAATTRCSAGPARTNC
jgi:Ca2+-binding RTX toxin-like protein